jgi:hypothetical protein
MLIENATAELHRARLRHQRDLAERTRFRRLVERVDDVIEMCEETHLQGIKEAPRDLSEQSEELLRSAAEIVQTSGDPEAVRVVTEQAARRRLKVTEIMDILWTVQEVVFDLMLPWRAELPEDVEVVATPAGIWRYDSAA